MKYSLKLVKTKFVSQSERLSLDLLNLENDGLGEGTFYRINYYANIPDK